MVKVRFYASLTNKLFDIFIFCFSVGILGEIWIQFIPRNQLQFTVGQCNVENLIFDKYSVCNFYNIYTSCINLCSDEYKMLL